MAQKKANFEEVEAILQDIGAKIEQLVEKGKEASGEAKAEIERKISELRGKKTTIEEELQLAKAKWEKFYREKRSEIEPSFTESADHFKEAFKKLLEGIVLLLAKK
jgi:chromosome segregation ATPase